MDSVSYPCPVCGGKVVDDDSDGIGYCLKHRGLVRVDEILAKVARLVK